MRPVRALPPDSLIRKARLCLKCNTTFQSEWVGERICPRCKGTHAWRSGGYSDTRGQPRTLKSKPGT